MGASLWKNDTPEDFVSDCLVKEGSSTARTQAYVLGSMLSAQFGEEISAEYVDAAKASSFEDLGKEVMILGPGTCFGETGLLDDNPRGASVSTRELCEFLIITKSDFDRVI